ncbi:molybdopterin-dependent oxidoreductase [Tianweitania sp. BSSL-BM11]|uniref:Molybdopterin-dependent oxidoreductase n=1 Tax=Tianweitania aestuarii TaxID=2814886 RepID=A0ABS5RUQ9_9HYPH|nr:molybdopterin-dependent oxidoreductase [Tianweitania aestuarii]MBS9719442.1 molybdopterin-dependent oxidoreductase [Tianweitania aestuarii]
MVDQDIRGYCTLCRSRCGTINRVVDGKLVAVANDPEHPTGKATCPKGRAAPEIVHAPDRLLYPMKRTRPKGEADPGWQRISWDEALDTIADRLSRIAAESGPEAVAFEVTTPSGTPISDSIDWIERFIRLFGSPNTIYGTEICNWHKDVAHAFTFGCGMPTADYARADLNILWGHNPSNVWLSQAGRLADGSDHSAKLLVIDPRETAHARQADLWLRVRPGTDAALALGLIRWMIRNDAFDAGFVSRWTNAPLLIDRSTGHFIKAAEVVAGAVGHLVFDQRRGAPVACDPSHPNGDAALDGAFSLTTLDGRSLVAQPAFAALREACEPYDPHHVEHETGIAPEDLERAARLIVDAGPKVAYHSWTGVGQQGNATQTERAIAVLYALTGAFDQVGGNRIYGPLPQNKLSTFDLLADSQKKKALGVRERPVGPPASGWVLAKDVYKAILHAEPYPVRALFGFGGNMLVSHPGGRTGIEALRALEFHVHCDLFHTPTNAYADILLPVSSPWEHEGLRLGFEIDENAAGHVQLRPQMVARRGEARPDYEIVAALATRMGLSQSFFGGSVEAGWNHMLEPLGLDVEALRSAPGGVRLPLNAEPRKYEAQAASGKRPFATPTGLVELYSERLLDNGYSPLPVHVPARPANGDYALRLVTAKTGVYCHSQHRNLPSLRRRAPEPTVTVHPALAARRGLTEGSLCAICTDQGEVRMRLRLSNSLDETVVSADYGWWQAAPDLGLPAYPITGEGSANINAIIGDGAVDPISGSLPLRTTLCDIRPVIGSETAPWHGWRRFEVAAATVEAEDARSIELVPADGEGLPPFRPGQHLMVRHATDDQVARAYSLSGASLSDEQRSYRITVKRQAGKDDAGFEWTGAVSDHINRILKPGDTLWLKAPAGRFLLPTQHTRPIVLFAAGIGITPFIGYLETLAAGEGSAMPEVILVYGNRNKRGHAFRKRIHELEAQLPRLRVVNLYSRPEPGDQAGADYDRAGRINAAAIETDWIERGARFYMCGPVAMMREMRSALEDRGVLPFEIHSETFASPTVPRMDPDACHSVEFKRSGVRADWTPSAGSVLDLAARNGVAMASGCRVGQCESCLVRLIEGSAVQPEGLPETEEGFFLGCQMIPASDIVVDA